MKETGWDGKNELVVELNGRPSGTVSPRLFGTNIEHTRACVYKGLSAQLLRNRKFAGKPTVRTGQACEWYPIGDRAFLGFGEPYTRHHEMYHMHRANEAQSQRIVNFWPGESCGIGQHELPLRAGETYEFRIVAKTDAPLSLKVELCARFGKRIYAEEEIALTGNDWRTYEISLTCLFDDADADLRLSFVQRASLCIGSVSLLPKGHFRGMRRDVIELLKQMNIKLIRWPGGNFAGEYNWADGLLPCDMRAPLQSWLGIETQPFTMGYDFHEIDTDDFIALCREVGAEPFITINPSWNTPEESAAWVEYCNGDVSTPFGRLRAKNGHPEKYNVRLWSLGNEFGYGHMEGENTPEGYARLARANAEKMLAVCPDLTLCSSGPYPNGKWARQSAAAICDIAPLVSQHFYAGQPMYRSVDAIEGDYEACVSQVSNLLSQLKQNRAELPQNAAISMDEWNVWYAWNRPSSVTDGIFAAKTLHMLMTQAQTLSIAQACSFEAVNEGLIEVLPHEARLTAQGQVFKLMSGHIGGEICCAKDDALATRHGKHVFLTVINSSFSKESRISLARLQSTQSLVPYKASLCTADSVTPPSYFTTTPALPTDPLTYNLPPHSILAVWLSDETDLPAQ